MQPAQGPRGRQEIHTNNPLYHSQPKQFSARTTEIATRTRTNQTRDSHKQTTRHQTLNRNPPRHKPYASLRPTLVSSRPRVLSDHSSRGSAPSPDHTDHRTVRASTQTPRRAPRGDRERRPEDTTGAREGAIRGAREGPEDQEPRAKAMARPKSKRKAARQLQTHAEST